MIRKNRGGDTKVYAKKDVVKSKAISRTKVLGATAVVLVAFLVFGAVDAGGEGSPNAVVKAVSNVVDPVPHEKINKQYRLAKTYKNAAHTLAHKRGAGHRYHIKLSPKTDNLELEEWRKRQWKARAMKERRAYLRKKAQERADIRQCTRAGFPKYLCPKVVKGAAMERKKHWAFDSNLAWIVKHESGFRPCVRNGGVVDCNYRGNRAFGMFQFLGSTWRGVGCTMTSDPVWQTRCGIRYIARRYGSPAGAVSFWRANRWY